MQVVFDPQKMLILVPFYSFARNKGDVLVFKPRINALEKY